MADHTFNRSRVTGGAPPDRDASPPAGLRSSPADCATRPDAGVAGRRARHG